MKKLVFIACGVCLSIFFIPIKAQKSYSLIDDEIQWQTAIELFEREKYGAAQHIFEQISKNTNAEKKMLANYYSAVCSFKNKNPDAGQQLMNFIQKYPTSDKINQVKFYRACFLFNNKDFKSADQLFTETDTYELPPSHLPEFYFKAGYCRFLVGDMERAKNYFYEIKDGNHIYADQASYYYGHILYKQGKYENALQEFDKLINHPDYKSVIPYYIAQIYYRQGKYEELLQTASPLLENTLGRQKADIARMIGDAYLQLENYSKAYEYLLMHEQLTKAKPDRAQAYSLAYAAYKSNLFEEAISYFQIAAQGKDSLSQNAWYHLGDCYLKTGQKDFAQNAFYTAYQLSYDQTSREDALFNYAKLSYELASDPYNESISALKKYLTEFPESHRTDEANQYLINLALISKNYKQALEAIENIKFKDIWIKTAQQRILYYLGIESFNENKYQEAIHYLQEAAGMDFDKTIRLQALYWTVEVIYRTGDYVSALKAYHKFLLSAGAVDIPEYTSVHYNIGYAQFKLSQYDEASVSFRKFLSTYQGNDKAMINDAYLRIGDCFFIGRNYTEAIKYYQKAYNNGSTEADYALYQIALSQGVQKQFQEKIATLKNLISKYPRSPYNPAAYYELALTSLLINKNNDALGYLDQIINKYPKSNYVSKSMLKKGMIYYNDNQNEKALVELKAVVNKYPGTSDAQEALVAISNIYVEMNRVDEYLSYLKTVPNAELLMSGQDSLIYVAAENQYQKGDCKSATEGFYQYVRNNPQGRFSANAWFYIGECARRTGNSSGALQAYENVTLRPGNPFMDRASSYAAQLRFMQKDYTRALEHYQRLESVAADKNSLTEAFAGQMRCFYQLGEMNAVIDAANQLMKSEKVTHNLLVEAHLYMGRAAFHLNNIPLAEKEFGIITRLTQSEAAAEAQYHLSLITFNRNDLSNAEKMTFQLINNYPSADYWRVKGFILLSDIYAANGNIFQARQTLQSIIDNYKGEDLRKEAQNRLNNLPPVQ